MVKDYVELHSVNNVLPCSLALNVIFLFPFFFTVSML